MKKQQKNLDVTSTTTVAAIRASNTAGGAGVYVDFSTINSGSPLTIISNDLAQNVSITAGVDIIGDLDTTGDFKVSKQLLLDYGTKQVPSLAFADDPDTGIYHYTDNIIGFSTHGKSRMGLDKRGNLMIAGSYAPFTGSHPGFSANVHDYTLGMVMSMTGVQMRDSNDVTYYQVEPC